MVKTVAPEQIRVPQLGFYGPSSLDAPRKQHLLHL